MPPTASASSCGGQHTRAGGQVHLRAFVVAGQHRVEFAGVRAQRVGEGLGDPAWVRVHESGVPDRIPRRVGSQLVHPGLLVPHGDGAQHAVDETGSRRVEFDAGLFDGGRHRGVRVDAGAQQLIGAQPQQIEQHRVDRLRRAAGGRADDRVEQPAGAAGAVGQLGGERRVAAADAAVAQQRGQGQVRVGVALADGPQHLEGGGPGRIQRLAPFGRGRPALFRGAGLMTPARRRRAGRRAPSRQRS